MASRSAKQPLSGPRDIRLFSVFPGSGSTKVEGELNVVSLDNAPAFEALSYSRGSLSKDSMILCNGLELEVSASLYAALWRLRLSSRARSIWVDAICIDLHSNDDRSAQVTLMHDIYARAETVYVWLGEEVIGMEEAWRLLRSMSQKWEELEEWQRQRPSSRNDDNDLKQAIATHGAIIPKELELPDPNSAASRGLVELLQKPWFSRSWVFPEVAFSNESQVLIGGYKTDWKTIVSACLYIRNSESERVRSIYDVTRQANKLALLYKGQIASQTDDSYQSSPRSTLLKLLIKTRSLQVSDAHDKIYSLLGLCFGNNLLNSKGLQTLTPNYNNSVAETYAKAAHYIVEQSPDLELLSHVYRDPDAENEYQLPSWVPDWRTDIEQPILGHGDNFSAGLPESQSSSGSLKQRKKRGISNPSQRSLRWQAENRYGDEEDEDDEIDANEVEPGINPIPQLVVPGLSDSLQLQIRGIAIDKIRTYRSDLWISDVHLKSEDPDDSVNDMLSSTYDAFWKEVRNFYMAEKVKPEFYSLSLGGHLSPPTRLRTDPFDAESSSTQMHKKSKSTSSEPSFPQIQSLHIRVTRASLALPAQSLQGKQKDDEETASWGSLIRYIPPAPGGARYMVRPEEAEEMLVDRLTKECWVLMAKMREGRSLFVTGKGWVGIAPDWIKENDIIMVAKGGRVPMVLRETGTEGMYKLVGEAYVHGIMDGEAEEWLSEDKGANFKDFVLC